MTGGLTDINNDSELTSALLRYTAEQFKKRFGYDYRSPPLDHAANTINSNDILRFFQHGGKNEETLTSFIKDEYFKRFIFVDEHVQDCAIRNLVDQLLPLTRDSCSGDWTSQFLDQTYKTSESYSASFRGSAIILYFYGEEVTETGIVVSMAYLYVLGMFYEVQQLGNFLTRDLISELSEGLVRRIYKNTSGENEDKKKDALKDLVLKYSIQEFKMQFGFDWIPSISEPDVGEPKFYSSYFEFHDFPPSSETIRERVRAEVFGDTPKFPPSSLRRVLFDHLVQKLDILVDDNVVIKDKNTWFSLSPPMEIIESGLQLNGQYSLFVYALGVKSEQDAYIKRFYVHNLTMFREITPDDLGQW